MPIDAAIRRRSSLAHEGRSARVALASLTAYSRRWIVDQANVLLPDKLLETSLIGGRAIDTKIQDGNDVKM
jgi:hypothetical protein